MRWNNFAGHHDFAESADIRRESAKNQELLEAKFISDLDQFRSDALFKLHTHDALEEGDGAGWGIFLHNETEDDDEVATFLPGGKATLILVTNGRLSTSNGHPMPNIRIITNELIRTPENRQWLTQDFSAAEGNDTQYMVDAIDMENQEVGETLAPLFVVNDEGRLQLSVNTWSFTPSLGIQLEDKPEHTKTTPFGDYENFEDKIHALSAGQALLEEVRHIEPEYITPTR